MFSLPQSLLPEGQFLLGPNLPSQYTFLPIVDLVLSLMMTLVLKAEMLDFVSNWLISLMIISIDGWTMSNIANTIVNSQPRISLKQYLRTGYNETTIGKKVYWLKY